MSIEEMKQEGLELTPAERKELIHFLLDSLTEEEEELSPEWQVEINRRWEEIKDGTAKLVSGKELSEKLTERFGVQFNLP